MLRSFEVETDSAGEKYFHTVSEGCGCCSDNNDYYGESARQEIIDEISSCESRIAQLQSMLEEFPKTERPSQ